MNEKKREEYWKAADAALSEMAGKTIAKVVRQGTYKYDFEFTDGTWLEIVDAYDEGGLHIEHGKSC